MFKRSILGMSIVALALVAASAPAHAGTAVQPGVDLWISQNGTLVDFSSSGNALPFNFFGCGDQFSGTISLSGRPITATPGITPTDTVIRRFNTVPNPTGSTPIQIQALCAGNNNWVDPCGNSWNVSVRLAQGVTQPFGSMTITHTSNLGGVFSSSFSVVGEVTWTDSFGNTLGPVTNSVTLNTTNACWSHTGGPGAITATSPLTIDANCDGALDTTLPGTSNFFPGWCPPSGGSGNPTYTPVQHDGPHPVGASKKKCRKVSVGAEPVAEEEPYGVEGENRTSDTEADADVTVSGPVQAYPCPVGYQPVG